MLRFRFCERELKSVKVVRGLIGLESVKSVVTLRFVTNLDFLTGLLVVNM